MSEEVKVQYIEGNGYPEYFQRYSSDPYLGKKSEAYTPAYDVQPVRSGITVREKLLTKLGKAGKLLVSDEG